MHKKEKVKEKKNSQIIYISIYRIKRLCEKWKWKWSRSVVSNSLQPHGL